MKRPDTTIVPKVLAAAVGTMVIAALAVYGVVPGMVGRSLNTHVRGSLPAPSAEAVGLHRTLDIVDLHDDALLWKRNLLRRGSWGHEDLPRMEEGRIAVQGFTTVTKTPRGQNYEANDASSDNVTLLAFLQGWPRQTWGSLFERALYQAERLHDMASASDGRLTVLTTAEQLDAHLAGRRDHPERVAGFLGIEGAQALEGDVEKLDALHAAGFRMLGLAHFFDNEVGGSAHGMAKGGLTSFGRTVLDRADELGIIVDLAHASNALIDDVLARAQRPLVVSHGGVRGTCDNVRNLDDTRLRALAGTGGVIGIGLWDVAVCGETPAHWAQAVRHAVDVMGIEHVALGSDWDGATKAIVDASETVYLIQALLDEGFSEGEIRAVMSENALRVLRGALGPPGATTPSGSEATPADSERLDEIG